jgi:hypothetical protein
MHGTARVSKRTSAAGERNVRRANARGSVRSLLGAAQGHPRRHTTRRARRRAPRLATGREAYRTCEARRDFSTSNTVGSSDATMISRITLSKYRRTNGTLPNP